LLLVSHDRDFLQGMSNIVYEFKDQKIKEYLGDINYFLEQRNLENMREVEKKDIIKKEAVVSKHQSFLRRPKERQNLAKPSEQSRKQIKQLEIDIQNDDKALASNYDKHIEDAAFFMAYNKKKKPI
jgi:ATP-binding cassette subfamily F protein 3